jgi:hypothetical protein
MSNNIFIDFAKTDFICPHCKKKYNDSDDKFYKRLNKAKTMIINIKCECGYTFKVTANYMSELVGFKLNKNISKKDT